MKTYNKPLIISMLLAGIMMICLFVLSHQKMFACGGSAPFQVFSGNVVRNVEDMAIIPGQNAAPKWGRFHNTIPRRRDLWFGTGGCWRHYWQYDLIVTEHGAEFIYPSGVRRAFIYNTDGSWEAREHFSETLSMDDNECVVTASDLSKLRFEKTQNTGTMLAYRLMSVTSSRGEVTMLDYGADGKLVGLHNDRGGSLTIEYGEIRGKATIAKVRSSDGRTVSYEYEVRSEVNDRRGAYRRTVAAQG